jgi:hypothetical protein
MASHTEGVNCSGWLTADSISVFNATINASLFSGVCSSFMVVVFHDKIKLFVFIVDNYFVNDV